MLADISKQSHSRQQSNVQPINGKRELRSALPQVCQNVSLLRLPPHSTMTTKEEPSALTFGSNEELAAYVGYQRTAAQ